ncbi:hypothetical protein V1511DRAFT_96797 [Dipodascopsis uninucleata]
MTSSAGITRGHPSVIIAAMMKKKLDGNDTDPDKLAAMVKGLENTTHFKSEEERQAPSKPLTHITKGRAKGPKRKLPTSTSKLEEPHKDETDNIILSSSNTSSALSSAVLTKPLNTSGSKAKMPPSPPRKPSNISNTELSTRSSTFLYFESQSNIHEKLLLFSEVKVSSELPPVNHANINSNSVSLAELARRKPPVSPMKKNAIEAMEPDLVNLKQKRPDNLFGPSNLRAPRPAILERMQTLPLQSTNSAPKPKPKPETLVASMREEGVLKFKNMFERQSKNLLAVSEKPKPKPKPQVHSKPSYLHQRSKSIEKMETAKFRSKPNVAPKPKAVNPGTLSKMTGESRLDLAKENNMPIMRTTEANEKVDVKRSSEPERVSNTPHSVSPISSNMLKPRPLSLASNALVSRWESMAVEMSNVKSSTFIASNASNRSPAPKPAPKPLFKSFEGLKPKPTPYVPPKRASLDIRRSDIEYSPDHKRPYKSAAMLTSSEGVVTTSNGRFPLDKPPIVNLHTKPLFARSDSFDTNKSVSVTTIQVDSMTDNEIERSTWASSSTSAMAA